MTAFHPFADDAAALTIGDDSGGLVIENGRQGIALHGDLQIDRDRRGLDRIRTLKTAIDAIHAALVQEEATLPAQIDATPRATVTIKNPFA